jgi:hypothetical protein
VKSENRDPKTERRTKTEIRTGLDRRDGCYAGGKLASEWLQSGFGVALGSHWSGFWVPTYTIRTPSVHHPYAIRTPCCEACRWLEGGLRVALGGACDGCGFRPESFLGNLRIPGEIAAVRWGIGREVSASLTPQPFLIESRVKTPHRPNRAARGAGRVPSHE